LFRPPKLCTKFPPLREAVVVYCAVWQADRTLDNIRTNDTYRLPGSREAVIDNAERIDEHR